MFWKFNMMSSHIDTLLDKEDVTLQEILDEDDVLQECKAQNRKLIDFLVRTEAIEELVNLITQEPSDDTDEKVRYKFPNTACELLTSDVPQITDKLSSEDGVMAKVYSFLESDGNLNPLLASFFSKVMGLLITRKSDMMLQFLQSKDDFVGQLLHHIGTSAIMDLLLRVITCIESPELRVQCINWLNEQNLIQKLVKMIHVSQPEEKHCNAAQLLCDMIRLSREHASQMQEKAEPDPLLTSIESQDTISSLLDNMFEGEKDESVIVNGLSVIQTLLEFRKLTVDPYLLSSGPDGAIDQMTQLDNERLDLGISNTLGSLTPRLKDIHNLLVTPPKQHYSAMPTSIGLLDPPLGNVRLQVTRLIGTLLIRNTAAVNTELANLGTINVALDLYFKYIWNNFLHTQVEQCIGTILNNPPVDSESKQPSPLLEQVFNDCKLIQRLLDSWEDNDVHQSRPGGHRRGYMGHLTRIANHIADNMDKGHNADKVKELFQEFPEETREKWENFVSGTLAEVNKQNTVELVGSHPLHSSSEDDDADPFREIPFPQDTAMQQLQQMTSNFIDQFGFNEDEFAEQQEPVDAPFTDRISGINFDIGSTEDNQHAATLFEQACNERMQQFDDQDSDEDIWEEKEITFAEGAGNRLTSTLEGRREAEQSRSDDSGGSTDSEEELDSPTVIRQTATSTSTSATEKMDIDNAEWQATFDDVAMDSAPVAMDTGSSPWDSSQPSTTTASSTATTATSNATEGWANFDDAPSTTTPSSSNDKDENWADFSSFTSIESANMNSTAPELGSGSPVEMDTAECSSNASRPNAYLVSSAPPDLASEVSSSTGAPSSSSQQNSLSKGENTSSVEDSNPVSSTTSANSVESTSEASGKIEGTTADTSTSNTADSFLAASGLMKSCDDKTAKDGATDTSKPSCDDAKAAEQAKLDQARAQAKEAMGQYTSVSGGGATTQNGPV